MSAATEGPRGDRAHDTLASRDEVMTRIVDQIERRGYFVVHLDPLPAQVIIDVRWAAQVAGGILDRRVRTYASAVGAKVPGKVTVVVTATDVRTLGEVHARSHARRVVADLFSAASNDV